MLRAFTDLKALSLRAVDGELGSVNDVYFEDQRWAMRYLVVTTGEWFGGKRVLISPLSISAVDWESAQLQLSLTQDQVRGSPTTDFDKPVSRQHESALFDYYGYPYYWGGGVLPGPGMFPAGLGSGLGAPIATPRAEPAQREEEQGDPHLRSAREVIGYHIEATDGAIGHVDEMLIEDAGWSVRFLVVDTRNWLPGRKVLVAVDRVQDVSWGERRVHVDLGREDVRNSPEYDRQLLGQEEDDFNPRDPRTPTSGARVQIR